jgi:outer membrane receptor protein involved in Fe transport
MNHRRSTKQNSHQPQLTPLAKAIQQHRRLMQVSLLAASSTVAVTPALAQDAASEDLMLEEITVTATKRAESLQDVPISIAALNGDVIEELGLRNFEDLAIMIPSMSFTAVGPGTATIYMRGASDGGDGNASGSQPSVGMYLDEAPMTAIAANVDVHLYDIERIEALAGPQGTLYGASNQSGTLRIITNKPDPTGFEGGFDVGGATTSGGDPSYSFEGFVNFPMGEKAALRLVAYSIEEGGWIDNVPGERTYQFWHQGPVTLNNDAFVGEDQNELSKSGLRAALRFYLSETWVATFSALFQSMDTEGTWDHDPGPVNPDSKFVYAPYDAGGIRDIGVHVPVGEGNIQRFHADSSEEDLFMGSWTLEGEIGNNSLIYAGAYMDRDVEYAADYSAYAEYVYYVPWYVCDYSSYYYTDSTTDCTTMDELYTEDNNYERQTHELRLSSFGEGRLHYTIGAYYTEVTHTYLQQWIQPGIADGYAVTGPQYSDNVFFRTDQERTDKQTAFFGELTYDVTEAVSLTGGVRFFDNETALKGAIGWGPPEGMFPELAPDSTYSDSDHILKGNLTWRTTDKSMVYFTYSEGYRPGGINRDPALIGTVGSQNWEPDKITNYEFGWKTTLLDGRMNFNGAAFFAEWDDIQYTVYDYSLSACCGAVYNLATAEMKGVEAYTSILITEPWTLSAAATWIDAETTADFVIPSGVLSVADGTELPNIPSFKASLFTRYEFAMGSFNSFVQLAASYTGSSWNQITPGDLSGLKHWDRRTKQDSYHNVNIRTGINQGKWGVDLFVNNLTDEVAQLQIQPRPYEQSITTNRPRTFGAKYWMRF